MTGKKAQPRQKCQSMKISGGRCGAFALKGSKFCSEPSHQDGSATRAALEKQKAEAEAQFKRDFAELIGPLGADGLPIGYVKPSKGVAPAEALARCESVFLKWLGKSYDLGSLHVTLAASAVERLTGDPLWVLIISGPGFTKTETVNAASGAGAYVESTIISEAALLSATPEAELQDGATGGLLRLIGRRGTLVLKDFTSILSMNRDSRAAVLAALREVFDGRWTRNVGTGGGLSIEWEGRIVVIGAVTTVWDSLHAATSSMGDRFAILRTDSNDEEARMTAGRQALQNIGSETTMREELQEAFRGVIAAMDRTAVDPTEDEITRILNAANLVTRGRTAVEADQQRNPIIAHAPEAPTRLAKQLAQVVRGGVAIGMDRRDALRLAIRCARDSMPPLRLAILDDLTKFAADTGHMGAFSRVSDIRKRLQMPRTTIDRELQALQLLKLVEHSEQDEPYGEVTRKVWSYRLADDVQVGVLLLD